MPGRLSRRQMLGSAIAAAGAWTCAAGAADGEEPPTANRANELLRDMTLQEKIGQMTQVDSNALKDRASDVARYFLGSVLSGGDSEPPDVSAAGWSRLYDELQGHGLKTRLKVPLLYGIDAVHGHNNVDGAVIFPHNVGLGATRSPRLVEEAARITAREILGTGMQWAFAPCIAVAQDERWGRTYESFGESPELVAALGVAAIRGLQGKTLGGPPSVLACAKHFLGDGGTKGGIDQGNTECDEATLRKIHLHSYLAAVKAGVGSIMVSYSSWNGKKLHGSRHLLTDLLKKELGFQGFLVSDWAAIDQLSSDYKAAIETSINAGLDMVMIPNGPGQKNSYVDFIHQLEELVRQGRVPPARIDDAVRRILTVKLRMKLFDHPFTDRERTAEVGSARHRQVARECVRHSLVLLKNERNALPLSKKARRLHVAGSAADDLGIQCGGWTISWQGKSGKVIRGGTTILAALRQACPDTQITHSADGADAAGADAAIVVVGEEPYAEMKGDRKDLHLPERDIALVHKVKDAGIPVITVLLSGRPLILGPVLQASDALVAAWLPGTEGAGVADVLVGDFKPSGKLPHTWPRSMDQVPCNVGAAIKGEPLFPYGFGLSY